MVDASDPLNALADGPIGILDACGDAMLVVDGGIVVAANGAFEGLVGWSRRALADQPVVRFFAPESHDRVLARLGAEDDGWDEAIVVGAEGRRAAVELAARPWTVEGRELRVVTVRPAPAARSSRLGAAPGEPAPARPGNPRAGETPTAVAGPPLGTADAGPPLTAVARIVAAALHELGSPLAQAILAVQLAARRAATGPAPPRTDVQRALADALSGLEHATGTGRELRAVFGARAAIGLVDAGAVVEGTARLAGRLVRPRARVEHRGRPLPAAHLSDLALRLALLDAILALAQVLPDVGEASITVTPVARDGELRIDVEVTAPASPALEVPEAPLARALVESLGGTLAGPAAGSLAIALRFPDVLAPAAPQQRIELARGDGGPPSVPSRTDASAATSAGRGEALRARSERPRVLVVDDHVELVRALAVELRGAYQVVGTTSGAEALDLLSHQRFDLILCDLQMPAPSGIDLYIAARELGVGLERRIVFMTGGALTPRAQSFLDETAAPIVEKPFLPEDLHAALRRAHGT